MGAQNLAPRGPVDYFTRCRLIYSAYYSSSCRRGSAVTIAIGYRLDGTGIESRWGRDFLHLSSPGLGPTHPPVQWVPGLSRGTERPERDADPSRLLVTWSRKSRAVPLLPPWAVRPVQSLSACTRVHFTFFWTYSNPYPPPPHTHTHTHTNV